MDDVISEIKSFVVSNFLFGRDDGLNESQSFLDSGIIDSTGVLELVSFIEQRFGFTVADQELLPENLDSLRNLGAFVARKRAAMTAGTGV